MTGRHARLTTLFDELCDREQAEQAAAIEALDDPELARELRELLEPLGVPLDLDAESIHPRALQEVLKRVEGRSAEPFVASLVLRST